MNPRVYLQLALYAVVGAAVFTREVSLGWLGCLLAAVIAFYEYLDWRARFHLDQSTADHLRAESQKFAKALFDSAFAESAALIKKYDNLNATVSNQGDRLTALSNKVGGPR